MLKDEKNRATAIGFIAVLLWALLALFTTYAAGLPPFQLLAMTFAVASLIGFANLLRKGQGLSLLLRQPLGAWGLSTLGLFGYHFFYFVALAKAPPVDASLIAYLWPLLIVLFSALLPGERLRWFHIAGALMGLCGATLLVTKGQSLALEIVYLPGYLAAIACALTWSSYSVTNRRYQAVPTDAVAGFCVGVTLLASLAHLVMEETVIPDLGQALAALALGLGPVGLAFFVWDYGTKHGHIQILGASAYAAPLLSTVILVAFGQAELRLSLVLACLLIVGGALLAARDMIFRRPTL